LDEVDRDVDRCDANAGVPQKSVIHAKKIGDLMLNGIDPGESIKELTT
jgi:hypothetical protein